MKRIPVFLLLCCLCAAPGKSVAQNPSDDSSGRLYAEIEQLFLHEDYGMARQLLEEYLGGTVLLGSRREAEYMLVCAEYALGHAGRMDMIRRYLDAYPDTPYANRLNAMLASAYFYQGNYKKCRALFGACELYLLDEEERDACTYRLAVSCLKVGALKEAAIWFRTLEEVSAAYRNDARYHLAYIDYARGDYAESLPVFLSLQEDAKYSGLVPYYIAEIYLQKRLYAQAEDVAAACLSSGRHAADALEMWRIRGMAQYHQGKYRPAIAALEKYCSQAAEPGRDVLYALAMSDYHVGIYAKAAELLGRVAGKDDALSQNALLHRGLSLLHLQDKLHARLAFEQASSLPFDSRVREEALYNYALCVHETAYSPFDESVTVFERFLNEFPNSAYAGKVSDYLVEVYMNTRSYEAALRSIAKIEHPDARILKAKQKILFQLGTQSFANARFEESMEYFNRSLQLGSYDAQTKADAFYWLGEACYRLGRHGESVRYLRSYLDATLDKTAEMHALAYYTLGYIRFKEKDYDLIILDVMMPDLDGFSVCRELRKHSRTPVIMLSARGEEYDRIHGFEVGIDDYVVKPFSPKELMLRVSAVLKRTNSISDDVYEYKGLKVDLAGRIVYIDGKKTDLTPKEYDLLFYLIKNKGIALTREKLISNVWGYDFFGDDRTLDTHIKLLRKNLGEYAGLIVTLRGVGYRFESK